MALIEKVEKFITAKINFTEGDLAYLKELTQNCLLNNGVETPEEKDRREHLFNTFKSALENKEP